MLANHFQEFMSDLDCSHMCGGKSLSLQALIDVLVQNMYEYIRLRDTLFWAKICDESDPKTS